MAKLIRNGKLIASGTGDYTPIKNKPKINGVELTGDKTSKQLKIFWIGTTAEYEALTEIEPNCVYYTTDDFDVSGDAYYTSAEVDGKLTEKQNRTDSSLQTTAKNIVTAINELHTSVKGMSGAVTVIVADSKPAIASVTPPAIYYVKTSTATIYDIYLYTKDVSGTTIETSLGQSTLDLSTYQTKAWTNTKYTAQTIEGILDEIATNFVLKSKILSAKNTSADDTQLYSAKYINDKLVLLDNLYKVGDIYETLSTSETTTTLAERFGGTWEALSDRKEWDESEADLTLQTGMDGSVHCKLYSNGMVILNMQNFKGTASPAIKIPTSSQYLPNAIIAIPCSHTNTNEATQLYIGTDGNCYGDFTKSSRCLGCYQTNKSADRTFKRFKRKS